MKKSVTFEWAVETLELPPGEWAEDHPDEDIGDLDHSARICDVSPLEPNQRIALVRNYSSDTQGLITRQYAYPVNGRMPANFDDADMGDGRGCKVPTHFIDQYAKWFKKQPARKGSRAPRERPVIGSRSAPGKASPKTKRLPAEVQAVLDTWAAKARRNQEEVDSFIRGAMQVYNKRHKK